MSIIISLYVLVFVVMPLLRLVQVDDVLLAGGLGAHLQHLHLARRHLAADHPGTWFIVLEIDYLVLTIKDTIEILSDLKILYH